MKGTPAIMHYYLELPFYVCIIICWNLKLSVLGSFSLYVCFYFWCQGTHREEGYSTPTPHLKFSTAGLRISGENVIDDVPFLYKFWMQKRLF